MIGAAGLLIGPGERGGWGYGVSALMRGGTGDRPNGRQATIADVAHAAKVSTAVVSRVLNADPALRVRDETRARVLAVVEELDYTPSAVARALRRSVAGALCLTVHDLSNPLHAEIMRGAQQRASEAGYVVLLGDAEELACNPSGYRNLLDPRRVDGLVLHPCGADQETELRRLAQGRLPTVISNARLRGVVGSVSLDDRALVRVALAELIRQGHRGIGLLNGVRAAQHARRRERALRIGLEAAGCAYRPEWFLEAGGWDEGAGYEAMAHLLELGSRPTAVVVSNVILAIGALAAARDRSVDVPGELSLIAIHDTWFANHTSPPLTTVASPLSALGAASVDVLLELLGGTPARHIVLRSPAPRLVQRSSCAPPRTSRV